MAICLAFVAGQAVPQRFVPGPEDAAGENPSSAVRRFGGGAAGVQRAQGAGGPEQTDHWGGWGKGVASIRG